MWLAVSNTFFPPHSARLDGFCGRSVAQLLSACRASPRPFGWVRGRSVAHLLSACLASPRPFGWVRERSVAQLLSSCRACQLQPLFIISTSAASNFLSGYAYKMITDLFFLYLFVLYVIVLTDILLKWQQTLCKVFLQLSRKWHGSTYFIYIYIYIYI